MRRSDREITDPVRINEILQTAKVLHLGLKDGDFPYVLPMHYGYEFADGQLVFYLHSAKEGHKLDLISADPNAAFALECDVETVSGGDIACRYGACYASVMGRGTVSVVEDVDEKIHGLNVLMQTQTGRSFPMTAEMAEAVTVLKLSVLTYSAKSRPKM